MKMHDILFYIDKVCYNLREVLEREKISMERKKSHSFQSYTTALYMIIMLCVYPLYVKDGYYNISVLCTGGLRNNRFLIFGNCYYW